MEVLQIPGCDPADRYGLKDQPGSTVGVDRGNDQAGGGRAAVVLFTKGCSAEDQAGSTAFYGMVRYILLISAKNNIPGFDF